MLFAISYFGGKLRNYVFAGICDLFFIFIYIIITINITNIYKLENDVNQKQFGPVRTRSSSSTLSVLRMTMLTTYYPISITGI